MDVVKYFKKRKRMFNSLGRKSGVCNGVFCSDCPFSYTNNGKNLDCTNFEEEYPEKAIAIVEKWAAEHPQKTMLQDFLERYPNAPLDKIDGTPIICPYEIGYEERCLDRDCNDIGCVKCWNRPIEG